MIRREIESLEKFSHEGKIQNLKIQIEHLKTLARKYKFTYNTKGKLTCIDGTTFCKMGKTWSY